MDQSLWRMPQLSTTSAAAIGHYRDAISELVAETGRAATLFDASRQADPCFVLAVVASSLLAGGAIDVAAGAPTSRGERQHVEIVRAWEHGDRRHALDLRREHLLEFTGDLFIVFLPLLDATARAPRTMRAAG